MGDGDDRMLLRSCLIVGGTCQLLASLSITIAASGGRVIVNE